MTAMNWYCPRCNTGFDAAIGSQRGVLCPICGKLIDRWRSKTLGGRMALRVAQPEPKPVQAKVLQRLGAINRQIRVLVKRDGWDCWLCGEPINPEEGGTHRASRDRVLPGQFGGTYALANLRLAHASCNSYRSGAKVKPFAPFSNSGTADMIRREEHEKAYARPGLERFV